MRNGNIKVMISSRCKDTFPDSNGDSITLTRIRRQIKELLEGAGVFNSPIFEVWINEDSPPQSGTQDSWDLCLKQVRSADILLVLYNGNAGWTGPNGKVGICHAELMEGMRHAPGKVYLIDLFEPDKPATPSRLPDKDFQEYVGNLNLFRGSTPHNIEEVMEQVRQTIRDSLVEFVRRGVREASRGRYHTGQALDWSRLNFSERNKEITKVLREAIWQTAGQEKVEELYVELSNSKLLTIVSAIPAAFSIAAAREIAGLPFLEDHLHMEQLKRGVVGPIHIVGCHKGVTERQALSFLGYPDSTVVVTPFGIYAADEVQNIQLILISNCRDETTTRHGVQRFFDWIEQTGEDQYLLKRAESRKQIVRAIAKEVLKG